MHLWQSQGLWSPYLQVWKDGAAHLDGDLLHNLDSCVPRLPALLAQADSLEEGQQRWDAQCLGHHREGPGCGVPDIPAHT